MKFTIYEKNDKTSISVKKKIIEKMILYGHSVDDLSPEIVIVVGGDGTFLMAVQKYIKNISNIKFTGVRTGTVGFFYDYSKDEIEHFVKELHFSQYDIDSKRLLSITIPNLTTKDNVMFAVNEFRIESSRKTLFLDVFINNDYLETIRGTGVCISTQLGSTGYNRSLRGGVIYEDIELIQLVEISSINHYEYQSLQIPLLLNPNSTIILKSDSYEDSLLCFDHTCIDFRPNDKIVISLSNIKKINILKRRSKSYIQKLIPLFKLQ